MVLHESTVPQHLAGSRVLTPLSGAGIAPALAKAPKPLRRLMAASRSTWQHRSKQGLVGLAFCTELQEASLFVAPYAELTMIAQQRVHTDPRPARLSERKQPLTAWPYHV